VIYTQNDIVCGYNIFVMEVRRVFSNMLVFKDWCCSRAHWTFEITFSNLYERHQSLELWYNF